MHGANGGRKPVHGLRSRAYRDLKRRLWANLDLASQIYPKRAREHEFPPELTDSQWRRIRWMVELVKRDHERKLKRRGKRQSSSAER
jgi:hypothetical protein